MSVTYVDLLDAAKPRDFALWHAVKPNDVTLCGRPVFAWSFNLDHRWIDDDLGLRCGRCVARAGKGVLRPCGESGCRGPHGYKHGSDICPGPRSVR